MNTVTGNRRLAVMLLTLVVIAIAPAYALLPQLQLDPPVVATVNLERVFNEINALDQAQGRVEQAMQPHREEADKLRGEAERLKEDLDLYVPGTEKYKEAEKAWTDAVLQYRAMVAFIETKLDTMRAGARKDIYNEIAESARKFAEANAIDFILTNDSSLELQEGNDQQIIQQLALRRIIYANPTFDATNDLINWINAP